ncbi:deoxyguanosinetriphosphate triphosphohydrolase [uncultured Desulfuromusa sp.]|uniref:deoxyguanosinetriphosphate triphosphohydrolase n=1 Tax=uncultured Desulfuromusa sp. TaxID=219183 RepID=UPI002AA71093|nr:deoxyguanosinetriphosphate triphosphohydrolase [uncultured Desulfuromusa sp.]
MDIRKTFEDFERQSLSPSACLSSNSKGRILPSKLCTIRTVFQHDRDRILHCKAFRRLKYKTQVFLSPVGDHYRTRLTHTLEVSQVARTISRALRLNEDLTEAISLGHDLGHTPFGHVGERVLNELVPGGFHHVKQSLRVVDILEKDGKGLNLTYEVRDGILKHSKGQGGLLTPDVQSRAQTLEGQVVRLADIIAYTSHDLDDAIRGHVIKAADIPKDISKLIGLRHSCRIDRMIKDLIRESIASGGTQVRLSAEMDEAIRALRSWLFEHVYRAESVQSEFNKASHLLHELFHFFCDDQDIFLHYGGRRFAGDTLEVSVADFIAGMTDRFALSLYRECFLPQPWKSI